MSMLLAGCLVAAIAATGALIITAVVGFAGRSGPPRGGPGLPAGPPPHLHGIAILVVVTGIFVLAWLAVLVAFARDQILRRLGATTHIEETLAEMRAQLAADRGAEAQVLLDRLAEYGEQRETDGYLHAMRTASSEQQAESNVHALRPRS
ncbi:hypothetical protein [Actinoplanes sp. NPDC051859]|uniref:hypothetical protein n=1 Tax=Actinoplanes sp. NPDC051859 TaxID=3363909 RepID=UPI00378A548A